jgi:CheY-like chemotaxis protein
MRHICVIDDDFIYTIITEKLLTTFPVVKKVSTFINGREAYQSILQSFQEDGQLPDICLVDVNMPIWDGWMFIEALSKLLHGSKLIPHVYMVSSSNSSSDIDKSKTYPIIRNYLTKPLLTDQLRTILSQL